MFRRKLAGFIGKTLVAVTCACLMMAGCGDNGPAEVESATSQEDVSAAGISENIMQEDDADLVSSEETSE